MPRKRKYHFIGKAAIHQDSGNPITHILKETVASLKQNLNGNSCVIKKGEELIKN